MVRAEHSSATPHATILTESLAGFPCLPAMVRAEHSSATPHATILTESLAGFPCLSAMVRAELPELQVVQGARLVLGLFRGRPRSDSRDQVLPSQANRQRQGQHHATE